MLTNIIYTLLLLEITCEKKISTWVLFLVCLNNSFFTNNEPPLTQTSLLHYKLKLF